MNDTDELCGFAVYASGLFLRYGASDKAQCVLFTRLAKEAHAMPEYEHAFDAWDGSTLTDEGWRNR